MVQTMWALTVLRPMAQTMWALTALRPTALIAWVSTEWPPMALITWALTAWRPSASTTRPTALKHRLTSVDPAAKHDSSPVSSLTLPGNRRAFFVQNVLLQPLGNCPYQQSETLATAARPSTAGHLRPSPMHLCRRSCCIPSAGTPLVKWSPGWGLFAEPCTAPIRRTAGATARRLINTGESGCRCGTLASWPLEREREYAGKRNGKRGKITDRIRVQISKRDPVKPLAKAASRIIAGCYAATSSCLLSGSAMQNIAPLLSLLAAQILP